MNDKCLIILSYIQNSSTDFAVTLARNSNYIICADAGQIQAKKFGLTPDLVIGDFDSTNLDDYKIFDCEYIAYPCEKDLTDTEACVEKAIELGYRDITLLGGIGGRLDHTLANIGVLAEFYDSVDSIKFIDQSNEMSLFINTQVRIYKGDYKFFGLISLDEYANGITIRGAKYELTDYTLPRATTLGISNEVAEEMATIRVVDGKLLLVRSNDF